MGGRAAGGSGSEGASAERRWARMTGGESAWGPPSARLRRRGRRRASALPERRRVGLGGREGEPSPGDAPAGGLLGRRGLADELASKIRARSHRPAYIIKVDYLSRRLRPLVFLLAPPPPLEQLLERVHLLGGEALQRVGEHGLPAGVRRRRGRPRPRAASSRLGRPRGRRRPPLPVVPGVPPPRAAPSRYPPPAPRPPRGARCAGPSA